MQRSSRPAGRPYTGADLDRASLERKDPEWVRSLAAAPTARAVAAGSDGVLVTADGSALARMSPTADQLAEPILLGVRDGAGLFAVDLDAEAARDRPADDGSWADGAEEPATRLMGLREAGLDLPRPEAGLAAYLAALLNWHRRNRHCANCGTPTAVVEAGFERRCPQCGAHHFPRTDPVVIMTVEHADRLLLGRRAGGPAGRFSVLAGFVSPGESAEEAVVREVEEESSIVCRDPVYVASQPWPFPASLMLGFHAVCDGGDPVATDGELEEVQWASAERVRAALRGEDPGLQLPGAVSIARFLIERWADGAAR